jgi:bis(5'-nucleosyl)-tetraphosphatase (symmetrical)
MKTMALYMIGDVQGCDAALEELLDTLDFSPSRDTLYLLGDLVNRGPDSAGVLRRLMGYGHAAQCLLGNHDLNLLAVAQGIRKPHRKDTLDDVLDAPDRHAMLHWLRHQKVAMLLERGSTPLLMVHAGVLPQWTANQSLALAQEVEAVLQGGHAAEFYKTMYGNTPNLWSDSLAGMDRLRVIVNALTRLRFCTVGGEMEFDSKDSAGCAPPGYLPWFEVPGRQTAETNVAFGHWSTLGWLGRTDILSLDTGCVWGGSLSALRFNLQDQTQELIQVQCTMSQEPGQT